MQVLFLIIADLSVQRQLETLGAQRAGLEDMLKEMKRKVCLFNGINMLKALIQSDLLSIDKCGSCVDYQLWIGLKFE